MKKKNKKSHPTNGWDALIYSIDKIYNLFKAGYFISAIIFSLIVLVAITLFRYPDEKLPELVINTGKVLYYDKLYIFPLSFALIFSLVANYLQHFYYKKEIIRLTKERQILIHGFENDDFVHLQKQ